MLFLVLKTPKRAHEKHILILFELCSAGREDRPKKKPILLSIDMSMHVIFQKLIAGRNMIKHSNKLLA